MFQARLIRAQLRRMQSKMEHEPLEQERKAQSLVGTLLQKHNVEFQAIPFDHFEAALAVPAQVHCSGAALYLHGGGYACGNLTYAKGFGSVLAQLAGVRTLCPAYRLAPEHPFPAALDDAMACYRHLLETVPPEKIALVGESAGGGLVYALCLRAKQENLPLPGGLVGISPWTDLTASGASYRLNASEDPSMTCSRLQKFAAMYTDDPTNPLVSPLFGDLTGLPESLLFAGGSEIMLDDAAQLHRRLLEAGCISQLTVALEMWHAYVLYGLGERQEDLTAIGTFLRRVCT